MGLPLASSYSSTTRVALTVAVAEETQDSALSTQHSGLSTQHSGEAARLWDNAAAVGAVTPMLVPCRSPFLAIAVAVAIAVPRLTAASCISMGHWPWLLDRCQWTGVAN